MDKTSRIYHYHITIDFKGIGPTNRIGRKYSGYTGKHSYKDTFLFFARRCSMVLSRTKAFNDGEILSHANNSINTQIIKALLCYYALSSDFPIVDKISIVRKRSGQPDFVYTECNNIVQPIGYAANRKLTCSLNVLDALLDESPKGQAVRIAMSYWLKGISSIDVYYKFDHLWRAFNRLFMYQGNDPREHECMKAMRSFILNNPTHFSQSIAITNAYSRDELHGFRWSRMILNDYDTRKKTGALVDFVQRYHDGRIMELLHEKLTCRNNYIDDPNNPIFRSTIDNHINSHLLTTVDAELVTLLSVKYAYFVRNKLFHGETTDGTFKVRPNNIDNEMKLLNRLLEVLVMELMDNHQLLRN